MTDRSVSVASGSIINDDTVVRLRCNSSSLTRIDVRLNTAEQFDGSIGGNIASVMAPSAQFRAVKANAGMVCIATISVDDSTGRVCLFDFGLRS